jgi:hypothetical protein
MLPLIAIIVGIGSAQDRDSSVEAVLPVTKPMKTISNDMPGSAQEIPIAPSTFDSCLIIGDIFFNKGQYDSACAAYFRARKIDNSKQAPMIGLYHGFLFGNHITEAAQWADRLQADYPSPVNRQRVAYTAGLLGKTRRITDVALCDDSTSSIYSWGIAGLRLRKAFLAAALLSKTAFTKTADSSFLKKYYDNRSATEYVPINAIVWGSSYSFDKSYFYEGGYAGGVSIAFGSLLNAIAVNAGRSFTAGRNLEKVYTVNYFIDSVPHTTTTTDKWRFAVPATGFDSSASTPPDRQTSVYHPSERDSVSDHTASYRPGPIIQNDLNIELTHRFSAETSIGVGGRYTSFSGDLFEDNFMGCLSVTHPLGSVSLRHRAAFNVFGCNPLIDEQQTTTVVTPGDTIYSVHWDTAYTNEFGSLEYDSLFRAVIDTFSSYVRWTWIEQKRGAVVAINTIQYNGGVDWSFGPFTASIDGSARWIFPNRAGIAGGLRFYEVVSLSGLWRYGSLRLAVSQGDQFLLDRYFTAGTIRRYSQYALDGGASWTPFRPLRIAYNFRYDDAYSCKTHSLFVAISLVNKRLKQ